MSRELIVIPNIVPSEEQIENLTKELEELKKCIEDIKAKPDSHEHHRH
jgi:hypothetical protein